MAPHQPQDQDQHPHQHPDQPLNTITAYNVVNGKLEAVEQFNSQLIKYELVITREEYLKYAIHALLKLIIDNGVKIDYEFILHYNYNEKYSEHINLYRLSLSIVHEEYISECDKKYSETTVLSAISYVKLIIPLFIKNEETQYCPIILPFSQTEEYNTKTVAKIIHDNYEGTKDDLLPFIQKNDCIEQYLKGKYNL